MINKIICGNNINILEQLENNSIDCQICSPPFFGLRSYDLPPQIWDGDSSCNHEWNNQAFCVKCNAWRGCLGLEPSPESYVNHLCDIFDIVYKKLKTCGTCFIELGDTYLGSGKGVWKNREKANKESFQFKELPKQEMGGWKKPKQLAMIPARVCIELQNRGWILRNLIVWKKGNALPTSSKDRFCCDFSQIFFFVKNKNYYFNQLLEPFANSSNPNEIYTGTATKNYEKENAQNPSDTKRRIIESMKRRGGRTMRAVWTINTKPAKGDHTASYPEELVERMIKSGCPENGIVLDIFNGTATTCVMAKRSNRNYIGIDLSEKYCEIARNRLIS